MKKNLVLAIQILTTLVSKASVVQYELYPNIHTVGISIRLNNSPSNVVGETFISTKLGNLWTTEKQGFQLSKVTDNYYAGCVFNTKPGTWYKVHCLLRVGITIIADITDSIQTMEEPKAYAANRTFYVKPDGLGISQSKGNPGKLDQNLINSLQAGDKVVLLEGNYFIGEMDFKNTGTTNKPITIEGENNNVWIQGGFENKLNWNRVTEDTSSKDYNTFYTSLSGLNTNCVVVDNKRLYPYRNLLELRSFSSIRLIDGSGNVTGSHSIGLDGFFRDGRNSAANHTPWTNYNPNLYIKFKNNSDTTSKQIEVSQKSYCFKIDQLSNIVFRKLNFRLFGAAKQNNYKTALLVLNADSILIDSCSFSFCDHAIVFTGKSSHNIIQHSVITDDLAKLSYFQFKETGLDYQHLNFYYPNFFPFQARNVEPGRIYFDHGYTGRGNIIRYNTISGGCDAITCPDTPGDSTTARHFDIYENTFGEGSDDAFEVDRNASNIRVWGNIMQGAANGISVASPCYGPVYIFRNVMHDFRKTIYQYVVNAVTLITDTVPASPLKLNAAFCDIPGEVFFMHNTVVSGAESYGFLLQQPQSKSSWAKVSAWNNIFYSNSKYYTLWVRATDSIDLDYNIYYSENGFSARQDRPNYAEYNNLALVKSNILGNINDPFSGIEKHGEILNPSGGWVNPAAFDFRLTQNSLVLNKGRIIHGINDNFYGLNPDPGAFEYNPNSHFNDLSESQFKIYPNPVTDFLVIECEKGKYYSFEFQNYAGQIIKSGHVQGTIVLDVQNFSQGIYLIKLQTAQGIRVAKICIP